MESVFPGTSREEEPSHKRKSNSEYDAEGNSKRKKLVSDADDIDDEHQSENISFESMFYPKGGLVYSLPGDIYQLKLQMLFLMRALGKGYSFQLGTEVEGAEKFDDVVFRFKVKGDAGIYVIRAVQVKHKLDENEHITVSDLISNDGDYGLAKYLISYLKMKQNPEFKKDEIKDVTLYTNIDFDRDNLEKSSIMINEIEENDEILQITKFGKASKRFKISVPKTNELYEKLRRTSDLLILTRKLVKHIKKNEILQLTDMFKEYHYVLTDKVFDIEMSNKPIAKFRHDFVTGVNLSEDIRSFRKTLQSCLKIEDNQIQSELSQMNLRVSKSFAQTYFYPSPTITDPKDLAKTLADIIKKSKDETELITIQKFKRVIASNINKFAFHILVRDAAKSELARFSEKFFDENQRLAGNLDEFRTHLKSVLHESGIEFLELKKYKFKINDFLTSEETAEGVPKYPKMELPEDFVKDAEIDEFLDKLVFALNQPNEIELGDKITEEMGESSQFNLLDANLVSNSFQKVMLDWFKHKEGVWLDAKSGKEFLDSIEQKIEGLISIGISLSFPEKMMSYCIEFKENEIFNKLNAFLSNKNASKRILHIISPERSVLSAINVCGTLNVLQQKEAYVHLKKKDSYIFMKLEDLLIKKIGKYVINAFNSPHSYDLLIIDCTSIGSQQNFKMKLLCNKLFETLSRPNKKVIFIATKHNTLLDEFGENLKTKEIDSLFFGNLTEKSKEVLLKKEVVFQGQKVCLNELINPSDEEANEIIDVELINKLINDEEVNIGKNVTDLGEIQNYYIHRKFRPTVFSKENIQKYLEENGIQSDLFVISGTDIGLEHFNIFVYDNAHAAEKKFCELHGKHAESNIHWLECDSKHLFWYKSYGTISNIIPYKIHTCANPNGQRVTEESELIKEVSRRDKIVIISDTAGMGKSTVFTHMSLELKKDSNLWVIRINLNDHTGILAKVEDNTDFEVNNINDIILKNILASQQSSKLEKKLFEHCLKNYGKIVLLFDGFDEISPKYKDIVVDLLQYLRELRIKNVYVSTRPNVKFDLERALGVFSYLLEPFSCNNQIDFLTKFWTSKLQLKNLDEIRANKLEVYVKCTINQISDYINDKEKHFVSNPLHLMMIAEVFQGKENKSSEWEGCKEFLVSEQDKPKMPEDFTLVKLYERFVKRKFYDIYLIEKRHRTLTMDGEDETADSDFKIFKEVTELLALKLLFSEDLTRLLCVAKLDELNRRVTEFKNGKHNKGIVDEIIDDKPHFIHRTFAEYFASFQVAKKILEAPFETLRWINNVILNMSPIFITSIIEQLDGKQMIIAASLKQPLLQFVVTDNLCSNLLKVLVQSNHNDWHRKLDAFGKSPLHYAVEHGISKAGDTLLDYADDIRETEILKHGSFKDPYYANSLLVKFINLLDNDFKTALYYAIQKNNFDMAFKLLLKGASISLINDDNIRGLIKYMLYRNSSVDIYQRGILFVYSDQDNKYRPIQEKLFLRAPGIFKELCRYRQSRILSYFFVHGRVQVIDALLTKIDDLEERKRILNNDDNGYTPLDRVLESDELSDEDRLGIAKYLFERNAISTRITNYGRECNDDSIKNLIAAAKRGHIKTLKYFLSQNEHDSLNLVIYYACMSNHKSIVKYLLENYKNRTSDRNGNTALHSACDSGAKLSLIKYLINYGDINVANHKGETPICMAIFARRRLYVIEYLVTKGSYIDRKSEDKSGNTPLSYAVENELDEITFYLLKHNAFVSEKASQLVKDKLAYFRNPGQYDLNLVDEHGYPRLHAAIMSKKMEWAKFLVRHGADINKLDEAGNAPIHLYYSLKNRDIVEFLLQCGAIFDLSNSENKTLYDLLCNVSDRDDDIQYPLRHPFTHHPPSNNKTVDAVFWLLEILKELFDSQNLMEDLRNRLGVLSEYVFLNTKEFNWGPYGSGVPCAGESNNPMLFILNARNNQGKTLFHVAAENNDVAAVRELIRFNRDCLREKKQRLSVSLGINDIYMLKYRDYQPATIDKLDLQAKNAPIHLAANNGHKQIIYELLAEGAIFNGINIENKTPKDLASSNNHIDTVEVLQSVENVFCATEEGNISDVERYLRVAPYVNVRNISGRTPLHIAALVDQPAVTQLLLDKGANTEASDLNKDTPLHIAGAGDRINNVMLLLKYEAIYEAKNTQGQRPLDLAQGQSRELLELIDTLFKEVQSDNPLVVVDSLKNMHKKYDKDMITIVINSRDNEGNTLLHYAAESCEFDIVECLLENGAIFEAENELGFTPSRSNKRIKTLLEGIEKMFNSVREINQFSKSVSIKVITNVLDNTRKGLLYYATELNDSEIIKFLEANTTD